MYILLYLADVVDGGVWEHGQLAEGSESVEGGEVDAAPDALGVVGLDVGLAPVVDLVLEAAVVEALNLNLGVSIQSASIARAQGLLESSCQSSPGRWAILQLLYGPRFA